MLLKLYPQLFASLLVALITASCGQPDEVEPIPRAEVLPAADAGDYATENLALDKAVVFTGLPRTASVWAQRTNDSRLVCGALVRREGDLVLYAYGVSKGSMLGAPLASLSKEKGARVLAMWNRAVAGVCEAEGMKVPDWQAGRESPPMSGSAVQ